MLNKNFRRVVKDMKDTALDTGKGLKKLFDSTLDSISELSEQPGTQPEQKPVPKTVPRSSTAASRKPLDPERKLLLELFREYPRLTAEEDLSRKSKTRLLALAREAYRRNEIELIRIQAQDEFVNSLHNNMTQDFGMLGIMGNLLNASRNGETVRWETYCSYAKRQMEELGWLEQQAKAPICGSLPDGMPVEELTERIRKQMVSLRRQPARTGYLPVYEQLKNLSFAGTEQELSRWYEKTAVVMARGLEQLDPYLRQALEEDYPEFSVSLRDGLTASAKSDSMEPSEKERKDDENGQKDS